MLQIWHSWLQEGDETRCDVGLCDLLNVMLDLLLDLLAKSQCRGQRGDHLVNESMLLLSKTRCFGRRHHKEKTRPHLHHEGYEAPLQSS